ncbi:MAG: insulinase family protein, partial [Flavobacteriaceae bacterium]|nr:insulinase family protein [Flavobacteriaceae bacterium]
DKIQFSSAVDEIGARINTNSDYDFSTISLTCVNQFWDKSWQLYTDAIMNPSFNEEEYKLLKEQLITNAKQTNADPDNHLRNLAMSNVFNGKNYAKNPQGTEESLQNISLNNLSEYYNNLIGKNRLFLVVAGNVSQEDITQKVSSSLAKLPQGTSPSFETATSISTPTNVIEDKDIATNYIRGYMNAPKLNNKEGVSMMLAMQILRNRLWIEVRTKRGLSYAPSAFYATGIVNNPYSAIYVTTIEPKETIKVMVDEIDKIRGEGFSAKELTDMKQSYLTQHYMGLETMASQTGNLGVAELNGDWKMSQEFDKIVNDISLDDINSVVKKYAGTISWTYLGKKDMITENDFLQPKKLKNNKPIKK